MGAPKNFYNAVDQAKLGIDQIPGMVKDIADIKEDISEITPLPDVTAADNGDVLTVIDGAWGKGTADKVTILDVTISDSTATITGELTFNDIIDKIVAGDDILFRNRTGSSDKFDKFYRVVFNQKMTNANTIIAYRCNPIYDLSSHPERIYAISNEFIVFYRSTTGYFVNVSAGLPDVTSDDNGDLLEVVSGAWAKSGDVKDKIQFLYDYLNLTGEELVHSYDFTSNANDLITTNPVNLSPNTNASFTTDGAAITANDLMQIRDIGSVCGFNRRLMFEFGVMNITAAGNLLSVYNGSYIKWDGTSWKINGTDTGITNPNYFYNKTLQIKIGASYNDVTMTTQDGVLYKGAFDPTGQFNGLMYGGYTPNGGCCYSMYLKSLKVYASY